MYMKSIHLQYSAVNLSCHKLCSTVGDTAYISFCSVELLKLPNSPNMVKLTPELKLWV